MKTIETIVFEFSELSDDAKEKARDWYREGALDYDWWESTYEDARRIGLRITAFDLDRRRQAYGDFDKYAEHCAQLIIKEHGVDCETFRSAMEFMDERARLVVKYSDPDSSNGLTYEGDKALEDCDKVFLKSILEDYSIILQKEYEYLLSDEAVDDSIQCNGYTFTESGKRFG
jgi:hypothetical protein